MDEAFACPECGTKVEVRGLAPGRQVRCGFCQRLLEVPYMPRVESAVFRRRRFGRRWWITWAWSGIGFTAVLIVAIAASRFLHHLQREAELKSIHDLVASSQLQEGQGDLGPAIVDLDTAINLCLQSSNIKSKYLSELKAKRRELARREAQAMLEKLEHDVVHPFPLGDWLTLQARIAADPDLTPLKEVASAGLIRKLNRDLQADLATASRWFQAGRPVAAFNVCEAATRLLAHLPAAARQPVHNQFAELVGRIIARNGIHVDPIRGHLLAGSMASYRATMIPALFQGLRAKSYVPRIDSSPWADRWSTAPYRLVVELNERLEGNYMSTDNRLTRIDAHLILSFQGREIWQTTPTSRTAVPLPNLPAYQSARVALKRDRSTELEQILYRNARGQINDKFAFALLNMPECGKGAAAGNR